MSGTGWGYFVPYQMDVQKALDELRQEVFDRGDYEHPRDSLDFLNEFGNLGFFSTSDEQERQRLIQEFGVSALNLLIERVGVSGLKAEVGALIKSPHLSSLAELKALQCLSANGTHSILDISRVEPEPSFGAVAPLPSESLLAIFGTKEPTHETVDEAQYRGKIETGPRWQAVFVIVYKGDKPDEIFISGSSGD